MCGSNVYLPKSPLPDILELKVSAWYLSSTPLNTDLSCSGSLLEPFSQFGGHSTECSFHKWDHFCNHFLNLLQFLILEKYLPVFLLSDVAVWEWTHLSSLLFSVSCPLLQWPVGWPVFVYLFEPEVPHDLIFSTTLYSVSHLNLGVSSIYSAQKLLYTIPANWLYHSGYLYPTMCWTISMGVFAKSAPWVLSNLVNPSFYWLSAVLINFSTSVQS